MIRFPWSSLSRFVPGTLTSLCLVAATFAAYGQIYKCDFVDYDDNTYVTDNPHVLAGLTPESMKWALTTTDAVNWHPLTWLSFQLDQQVYGWLSSRLGRPVYAVGFHLTNLVLHVADALLLFFVLRRMTGRLGRSAFVAALFALHPLHVESVAWVSERKDVLSTLFWMLTLAAYVLYTERPGWMRYLLVVLAFGLGLMAKSMLVTLPGVLFLLDYWPLWRFHRVSWRRLIGEKIPLLALSFASAGITLFAQRQGGEANSLGDMPPRIANALIAYMTYISKALWPVGLVPFYPFPKQLMPAALEAGALLTGVTILVLALARNRPYLAVGWFWYLGTLVPVLGVVQVLGGHAMTDRYTYVPLIGLFILLVWGATEVLNRAQAPAWAPIAAGAVLLAGCAAGTWYQVGYWRDSVTLWRHTLEVIPENYMAHNNLGYEALQKGNVEEAEREYRMAVEYGPGVELGHFSLGCVLSREGKVEEAVAQYREAARLNPKYRDAEYLLGATLIWQRKIAEGVPHLEASVNIDPTFFNGRVELGRALYSEGKSAEAVPHFEAALRIDPKSAQAHNDLGLALMAMGDVKGAVAEYEAALRIEPNYGEARDNLATAQESSRGAP
jgi:tetratricopeptide (TPR) repeat protein